MVRVIFLLLALEYVTYLDERFTDFENQIKTLKQLQIEQLEIEQFILRYKKRTDLEEFRFQEIGKQLEKLRING